MNATAFADVTPIRRPKILVVDDEVAMVRSLELLLRPVGDIMKAYSVPEAEEYLEKDQKVDCIVTDVSMPEASGLTLLDDIRKRLPEIPVIVITAYSSVPQAVQAMNRGAFQYVVKPFENAELLTIVKRAISKKGVNSGETRSMPTGWICNSLAMKSFVEKAERLALLDTPLLLLGETGVGKGRAARWMHERNPENRKRSFLALDGRTHEEDFQLLQKPLGKDVGTIFIAEIFSLRPRLQDRVAEILQQGNVRIMGSSSSSIDYQSLPTYREDLRDQMTAMSLTIPSLRERPEDFEALVEEKVKSLAARLKQSNLAVSAGAMAKLKAHSYSGNVRELERVLERSALEARAEVISEENIRFDQPQALKDLLPFTIPVEDGWNRLQVLHENLERQLILDALEKYPKASNTQIAAVLGTTRRILELRMKDYSIRENF